MLTNIHYDGILPCTNQFHNMCSQATLILVFLLVPCTTVLVIHTTLYFQLLPTVHFSWKEVMCVCVCRQNTRAAVWYMNGPSISAATQVITPVITVHFLPRVTASNGCIFKCFVPLSLATLLSVIYKTIEWFWHVYLYRYQNLHYVVMVWSSILYTGHCAQGI